MSKGMKYNKVIPFRHSIIAPRASIFNSSFKNYNQIQQNIDSYKQVYN